MPAHLRGFFFPPPGRACERVRACVNSWQAFLRCCVNRKEGILAEVMRRVGLDRGWRRSRR